MTKKILFLVLPLLCINVAQAKELRFTLKCKIDKNADVPKTVKRYAATKIATQGPDKKWENSYVLEVYFKADPKKAHAYPFVPGGSGDEDYNEYDLGVSEEEQASVNVQGGVIQNKFAWVSLTDTEGYSFARCD